GIACFAARGLEFLGVIREVAVGILLGPRLGPAVYRFQHFCGSVGGGRRLLCSRSRFLDGDRLWVLARRGFRFSRLRLGGLLGGWGDHRRSGAADQFARERQLVLRRGVGRI